MFGQTWNLYSRIQHPKNATGIIYLDLKNKLFEGGTSSRPLPSALACVVSHLDQTAKTANMAVTLVWRFPHDHHDLS